MMWGALLHLGIQSRLTDWFGESTVGYYFLIIGAVGGVIATATQITVGALSDRCLCKFGRRRPFIIFGTTFAVAALLSLGHSRSFWPFAVSLFALQFFSNIALGPFTALLPDTINPIEHGKASGFMGVARLLGDTGGLILAGVLLSTAVLGKNPTRTVLMDFRASRMFLLCSIIASFIVVTAIYTCFAIKEQQLKSSSKKRLAQTIGDSFAINIRENSDFFWLSISRAVTNIGFYIFLETLLFFVKFTLHVPDPDKTNIIIMLPAIGAAILSSIPSGILSDLLGRKKMIFTAQFLMAGAGIVFAFSPNIETALAAAVPAGGRGERLRPSGHPLPGGGHRPGNRQRGVVARGPGDGGGAGLHRPAGAVHAGAARRPHPGGRRPSEPGARLPVPGHGGGHRNRGGPERRPPGTASAAVTAWGCHQGRAGFLASAHPGQFDRPQHHTRR